MSFSLLVSAVIMLPLAIERGEVTFKPGPEESSVPEHFRLESSTFSYELRTRAFDAEIHRFTTPFPVSGHDPRPGKQRGARRVFRADRSRTETSRRGGVAHSGCGFPTFEIHGGPTGRPGSRGALPEAALLRGTATGYHRPQCQAFLSTDIERSITAMRQGICDVRRATCWLNSRPDVNGKRLGVSGISLGGIVSSVAAAVDPSIQQGAFLLAGGDLSRILWEMPEGAAYRSMWIRAGRP